MIIAQIFSDSMIQLYSKLFFYTPIPESTKKSSAEPPTHCWYRSARYLFEKIGLYKTLILTTFQDWKTAFSV